MCDVRQRARDMGMTVLEHWFTVVQDTGEKTSDRLEAGKSIMNRGYGTPTQTNELTGLDGKDIVTRIVYGWADSPAPAPDAPGPSK